MAVIGCASFLVVMVSHMHGLSDRAGISRFELCHDYRVRQRTAIDFASPIREGCSQREHCLVRRLPPLFSLKAFEATARLGSVTRAA
jgi:hypothetical protein